MKAKLAKTLNTKSKRIFATALCVALVLSLGTVATLAATAEKDKPEFHVVTDEEYTAIQAGEVSLDDGVPRVWSNLDTQEQVRITEHKQEFHIVTNDEYDAIQAGETSLDDGVPRIWSNPDMQEQVSISNHN